MPRPDLMLERLKPLVLTLALLGCAPGPAQPPTAAGPAPVARQPAAPALPIADPKFDALPGATARFGTRNGYAYRIEVPERWNGTLVMWAHGFRGTGGTLRVDDIPARQYLIERGFAWAASSYSANGWAVREGSDDTLDLARFFAGEVGKPERTLLFGASMGGNVVTDSLEAYPEAYQGALAICGALTGTELFDYFLSYGLLGEYFTGERWLPTRLDESSFYGQVVEKVILPRLGRPGNYTVAGRQWDSAVKQLSGGERPFRIDGMLRPFGPSWLGLDFYTAWFGAERGGIINLAPGRQVTTNLGVRYQLDPGLPVSEARLNDEVRRIAADPARNAGRAAGYAVPTGDIRVPVLTLHTTGDAFVPMNMEVSYRRKVNAAGRGDLLVQRAVRAAGHCEFTGAEIERALDDLVAWVADGRKPRGEDMLGSLADAGREWTMPLRPGDPGRK